MENEPKSIVLRKSSYEVGDGKTRIAEDWERPLTSEEKYKPSLEESVREAGYAINDLSIAFVMAFEPIHHAIMEFVNNPTVQKVMEELSNYDPKEEARKRSKLDLAEKRRASRRKGGRSANRF
jgi:hypothetical protein